MPVIKNNAKYIFPLILFLIVIVLAMLGIHGSSIGIYNQYFYGPDYQDPNLLFGEIRPVRSDEYLVSSPWALAQVKNGLEEPNIIYLAQQNTSISDAPTDNWPGLFEPQNWGFLILPVEQAFAYRWWIKAFMVAVAAYVLFMMISENNLAVSMMAALSLTFSPFLQWWYGTSVTEIASYGIFTFIFFLKLVNDRKLHAKLIDLIFLIYFAICFSLTLYPPFQIPLAVLFIFAGAGYLFTKTPAMTAGDIRNLIANIALAIVVIIAVVVIYYVSHQDAFESLAGTVYPGIRQSNGGDMMPLKALAGFYNIQLLENARTVPAILNNNQSEASSFFFISLFLLPFLLYNISFSVVNKKDLDLPLFLTVMILCVLLVWGTIGFPGRIARLLLLNFIDAYRMLFMLGIANHLLIMYFLFRVKIEHTLVYRIVVVLYSLGVFLVVYGIGNHLRAVGPNFIGSTFKILFISAAAGLMMFLLLHQKRDLFSGLFLAFTITSTYYVNPLYRGLSPLLGSEVSTSIQSIHEQDPQAGWVGYDNLMFGNYLAANGIPVLNGTYYYPNLDFWSAFDPDHNYESIYNRYSHILVLPSNDSAIDFQLLQTDVVQINISPCSTVLRDLGIRYYLFSSPPPDTSCLTEVDKIEYPKMLIHIFKRAELDN